MTSSLPRHPDMTYSPSTRKGWLLVATLGLSLLPIANPTASAQDIPPQNPPTGVISGEGGPTAAGPGGISPGSSNFKGPVNSLLDLYEHYTNKRLIRDSNLDGLAVPISMNASGLSDAETVKLIEATLLLNNIAIVPVDDHTVKIVTIGVNKNPRSEGVKVYANASDLPLDDEIVSYYMPLNYANPQEVSGVFTQVAPPHATYGGYVPAPSAQAIVLTENTSTIRQLITLKDLIDVPPARVVSEWVQLNRADSDKVADILNKMLGQSPTGAPAGAPAGAGNPNGVVVPAGLGNNEPLSNEKNLISGNAQIISDPRSNRILLVTRPVNIPFLEQMVGQLDQPDIFMVPQRRPLKYVLAQDILAALEAALAQGKDEVDQVKKDQTTAQTQQTRNGQTAPGQTQQVSNGGTSSGGSGSVSAITPQLAAPNENDVPTVVTVGNTRLMADNRSNSIIVFGSPDIVSRTFDMIDQLDRKPLQVYLATVIGELTVSQGEEFGIDILQNFQHIGQGGLASSNLNTTAGTGTGAAGNLPNPRSLINGAVATATSTGFPILAGLNIYAAIGSTLNAYVRALETTDRFKIISRPSVFTENNKLAVIASGSQVPVPSSTTSGFTGTSSDLTTTSSIAYEDVLLQLDIIPLINANHEVTLKIRQTNNSLGKNQDISGNLVPIINTQEINTEVTVPNKATVAIGGLITDNTSRDSSGVPLLSDIPVLKYLFSDTSKNKERDELIIMIQPSVVETDADQIAVNEEEKARTILGREAVETTTGVTQQPPPSPFALPPPSTVSTTQTSHTGAYNSKTGVHTGTTTTTTTIQRIPTTVMTPVGPTSPTGPVPAFSSPAPDVGNATLPKVNPPTPTPTAP